VRLDGVPEPAQIARYSPDGQTLLITSLRSGTATLIDRSFTRQTTLAVGKQPMDGAFRDGILLVACQGDGSVPLEAVTNVRTYSPLDHGCPGLSLSM
jgi:hypothetical protein